MVEEGRQYIIINKISPLALTLTDDDDGLVLASKPRNGRNDQKVRSLVTPSTSSDPDLPPQWIPIREEDGLWALKSVAYGKFLATAGQPIVGAKLIGANSQTRWEIIGGPQGPKFFRYR